MGSSAQSARDQLGQCFLAGILGGVVATFLLGLTWPDEDDGLGIGALAALVLSTVSGLLLTVAIIGWAVMLGVRAADLQLTTPGPRRAGSGVVGSAPVTRQRRDPAELEPLDPPS